MNLLLVSSLLLAVSCSLTGSSSSHRLLHSGPTLGLRQKREFHHPLAFRRESRYDKYFSSKLDQISFSDCPRSTLTCEVPADCRG